MHMKKDFNCQNQQKIILSEKGKYTQVEIENISHIYCEGYLSFIKLIDKENAITVSRSLKSFEQTLLDVHFLRINRNCLINLKNVTSFDCKKLQIMLRGNTTLKVSRRQCSELLKFFHNEQNRP